MRSRKMLAAEGQSRAVPMIRVLAEDPDLAGKLTGRTLELARAEAIAAVMVLGRGPAELSIINAVPGGYLGLLVLDGLLARHVTFGRLHSTELVGPGDL